jgi:hypothetical protein
MSIGNDGRRIPDQKRQRRSKLRQRGRLGLESLEPRQLLASNFLQGTAFLDSNTSGTYDPGEALSGAMITLYHINADLSLTQVGLPQTTGADGNYLFTGLATGNYRLIETPPSGDSNSAAQTNLSLINRVVAHTSSSIDVTISDPGTTPWKLTWPTNSQNTQNFEFIAPGFGTVQGNVGQYNINVNEPDISYQTGIFPSDCVDIPRDLNPGDTNLPYSVKPLSQALPASSYSANAGRIAYLYSKYLFSGLGALDASHAAGLQLAIFELEYETQSAAGPNYLTTGNFKVTSFTNANFPSTVAAANAYVADAMSLPANTNVQAAYLNGLPTTGRSTGSQGLLAPDSLNFGNVRMASPAINTVAGGAVIIGSGTKLSDTAVLTGGSNPTGSIIFTLTYNGNTVDTETVTVNGNNTYSTPNGYLPTATGNYLWSATYSGDSNNKTATDNGQNEAETVTPASPGINTVAGGAVIIGSGLKLTDTAVLSGGYNPTGIITFTLTYNGTTVVDTETVTVNGDNTYSTPNGYLPTATGNYVWSASYSGDSKNNSATDNGQNEAETVTASSPGLNTVAGGTVIIGSGMNLTDNAILSGGFNPTGIITFTLTYNGNTVDTETVNVSGDGTYSTPNAYLPTATGS